ncbi:MAG: hypothetical protein COB17_01445 [Sulfurimonas sp.]|nr:MAG: hypothetical protein COB17_01445 [Sulfurimonas sp.]
MRNNILRWLISLLIGIAITLVLFLFMNSMISNNENMIEDSEFYKVIDFISATKDNSVPDIKKELPPEPKIHKVPPKVQNEVQDTKSDNALDNQVPLNIEMPSVGSGMKMGRGAPKILSPIKMLKMDSVLTPMVQIKPLYPSRAKRMGLEGYVKVELSVDATGHVTNIKILKSVPKGVFDKSVKKALRRWKFRAKSIDGKAVSQKGVLTLNFNLGKS